VVPVYIHGSNGLFFQLAGLLHAKLRTALLPRELLNKSRTTLRFRIGQSIPHLHLTAFASDGDLMDYLRFRTYLLADIHKPSEAENIPVLTEPVDHEPVAPAINANLVKAEIQALPENAKLLESGSFQVYCADASQIPWCLQEIGRLREQSFRDAGEGTGKATDIDFFDSHYLHLFAWDRQAECIVGAYRLGLTDRILPRYGRRGLYTQSLFRYGRKVLNYLDPAIELGRSFVRPEYQKSMAPLFLLWRGIGEFVVRNPRYALLFGPVSISNDYDPASRSLLVKYLRANCVDPDLSRFVKPRRPFRGASPSVLGRAKLSCIKDIDHISRAVAQIEQDSKGVPVLLKQYLKLGGRILAFNSDDQFSDSLDGLIVVDMRRAEPQTLARYMGPAGVESFLAWHARPKQIASKATS
jgi:putative hemolysin